MANDKKNSIDPNKSQSKGSRARIKRKLNLSTSLLHGREMRKVFGCFPEHTPRIQRPVWLGVEGKKVSQPDGIRHILVLPQTKEKDGKSNS